MSDRRRRYDSIPDLDRKRDLSQDLTHSDQGLSKFGGVGEESRSGPFVEDEIDGTTTVDIWKRRKRQLEFGIGGNGT